MTLKNTFLLFLFIAIIGAAGFFIFESYYGEQNTLNDKGSQTGDNVYTRTVDRTRDTQLRADATRMAYALKAYQINNVLPSDFPTKKTCIGTKAPCYDLTPLLVPNELEDIPTTPGGNQENTGFYVKKEGSSVVVGAEGNLEDIEIVR